VIVIEVAATVMSFMIMDDPPGLGWPVVTDGHPTWSSPRKFQGAT
jgi:hypothetical protein